MCLYGFNLLYFDVRNEIMEAIRNTKNKIFAMLAAPAAIPLKPSTAAIIAMIKNVTV